MKSYKRKTQLQVAQIQLIEIQRAEILQQTNETLQQHQIITHL